jgi:tRNA A22 N-methylase
VALCPDARIVVDVGADHGRVAAALGAIATERRPHRRSRAAVRWVIADGLAPFRAVDVAIVAGMGAATIARILTSGPTPSAVILHAQDDPIRLRRWLAANGWAIDAERLAPEAGRFAEVIRAMPGREPASGLSLDHGPRLLAGGDPWLAPHLHELVGYWSDLAARTASGAPEVAADARSRAAFLDGVRRRVAGQG